MEDPSSPVSRRLAQIGLLPVPVSGESWAAPVPSHRVSSTITTNDSSQRRNPRAPRRRAK